MNRMAKELLILNYDVIETYGKKFEDIVDDSYGLVSETLCRYASYYVDKYKPSSIRDVSLPEFRKNLIANIYNSVLNDTSNARLLIPIYYFHPSHDYSLNEIEVFGNIEDIIGLIDLENALDNEKIFTPRYQKIIYMRFCGYSKHELAEIEGITYIRAIQLFHKFQRLMKRRIRAGKYTI